MLRSLVALIHSTIWQKSAGHGASYLVSPKHIGFGNGRKPRQDRPFSNEAWARRCEKQAPPFYQWSSVRILIYGLRFAARYPTVSSGTTRERTGAAAARNPGSIR